MKSSEIPRLVTLLSFSIHAEEREAAATGLAKIDWQANPQAVSVLLTRARRDPSPGVRAACVHSLAQMNANSSAVLTELADLRKDTDPRVQKEVNDAITRLRGN